MKPATDTAKGAPALRIIGFRNPALEDVLSIRKMNELKKQCEVVNLIVNVL